MVVVVVVAGGGGWWSAGGVLVVCWWCAGVKEFGFDIYTCIAPGHISCHPRKKHIRATRQMQGISNKKTERGRVNLIL